MSCVDSAIIRALVEHVGMDPDGVPLGTPITGEAPITVSEDKKVSIAIDDSAMNIKDGKLSVTPVTAEAPISISEDKKVSLAIDSDTMEVKNGKLAVLSDTMVTTAGTRQNFTYSISGGKFIISGAPQGSIHVGDILITPKNKYVIAPPDTLLTATSDDYAIMEYTSGSKTTLKWNADDSTYSTSYSDFLNTTITDEHGIFSQRSLSNNPVPVMPAKDLLPLLLNLVQRVEVLEKK